jgi:D-sedoheptulose 7-phosphate isomerase
MRQVFYPGVDRIAAELLAAYRDGRTVFIFGNGGSAATASHFACDLSKGATTRIPAAAKKFRVIALTENTSLITAWANDSNYEDIFAEQLRNLLAPDDVVLAISGSGNSPNVLKALELALCAGAHTIGLTGFRGGKMKPLCRTCLVVPCENMEVIEDVHLAACHAVSTVIRQSLFDCFHRGAPETRVPALQTPCSVSVTTLAKDLERERRPLHCPVGLSQVVAQQSPRRGSLASGD